jgi:poly(3-hydroxybutyrate) depolymerase
VGGGHSWPGADPKEAVGLTTQQISATSLMLSFFARYS